MRHNRRAAHGTSEPGLVDGRTYGPLTDSQRALLRNMPDMAYYDSVYPGS